MKSNHYLTRKNRLTLFDGLTSAIRQASIKLSLKKKLWLIEAVVFILCAFTEMSNAQNLEFVHDVSNSDGFIEVIDIAVDGDDNIFVTGHFEGDQSIDFDPSSNTAIPRDAANDAGDDSYDDIYLAKYDEHGGFLWVMAIYTRGDAHANPFIRIAGVEVDASGNAYIAGHVNGTVGVYANYVTSGLDLLMGTSSLGNDYQQPFLIAVDGDGNKIWSSNPLSSVTEVDVNDIAITSTQLLIAGNYGNGTPMGLPSNSAATQTNFNGYVAAFDLSDGSLSSSERLLTSIVASSDANDVNGLEVDGSGNIYITGHFKNNTDFDPGSGNHLVDGGTSGSSYIAKYNSSFDLQWIDSGYGDGKMLELAGDGDIWASRSDDSHVEVVESWSSSGTKSSISLDFSFQLDEMAFDSSDDIYIVADNGASLNGQFEKYNGTTGSQIFSHDIGANTICINANCIGTNVMAEYL